MKSSRFGTVLSLLLGAALVVAACGVRSTVSDTASDAATSAWVACAGKPALRASGSAAQQNAIEQFVYAYARACPGRTLSYDAVGATAGVDDFASGATDLAGSELALDPAKGQLERTSARCGSPVWQLPVVFNPIAITYNLGGVGSLNLDGTTAAKIFDGTIATWDHPAIKALNASTTLPSIPIRVVFRSDRTGTTASFQKYLDDASDGAWNGGTGDAFSGGAGEGIVGNEGVSAAVLGTEGAVSFTEWAYALGTRLPMARIITSASPVPVPISAESAGRAIAGARFAGQGNDLVLDSVSLAKPTAGGAYPIVSATYEIVCSKYPDAGVGVAVRAFLQAALGSGQDGLDQYGAVPLPTPVRSRVLTAANAVS